MKKSSCRGLPTTVAGIDRVGAVRDAADLEDRVVVLQRVVAVVIAKRPFGPAHARRHLADQRELRVGDQRMRPVAVHLRQALAGDERGQHQLGHVLGQRRDGRQDQRRRAAEEHRRRQRLRRALRRPRSESRRPCRSASACRSCARRSTCMRYMPRLWPRPIGMRRVDERQRDERPAVLGPARDRRQPIEPHVGRDALGDRSASRPRACRPSAARARRRARPTASPGVGGSSVSASSTRRRISRSGRSPNASSARRAVPNRLVTSRKSATR